MLAFKDAPQGEEKTAMDRWGGVCAHCFMENCNLSLKFFQSLKYGIKSSQDLWDTNASYFSAGSRKLVSCSMVSTVFIRLLLSELLLLFCITTDHIYRLCCLLTS